MKICDQCGARYRGSPSACPLDGSALHEELDELLGRVLSGRYMVIEKIGEGGMGTVYRASDEHTGTDVALKFLASHLSSNETHRERFLREARAANRVDHEHIIEISDFGTSEDGLVFLVMECLVGAPLNEEIAKGPLEPIRALDIALQTARALARAHELNVIHRDIKPDNIFLIGPGTDDYVKVLDFGLARIKGELRLTATGSVFGTPEYIAPEQALGASITGAVDMYALGVVIFEMMTGRLPFTGSMAEQLKHHVSTPPPAPSRHRLRLPDTLDPLVLRMLSKDPRDRHENAYVLAEEMAALLVKLGRASTYRGPLRKPAPVSTMQGPVEDAWGERVAVFRVLMDRAHPNGDAPPWLWAAVEQVGDLVKRLRGIRGTLEQMAGDQSRHQDEVREARMRVGEAVDELGRDEARLLREIAEDRAVLAVMRDELEEAERQLLQLWGGVPPMPASGPSVDKDLAEYFRHAGKLASTWLEDARAIEDHERQVRTKQHEQDDLRFQIGQLKGRMGAASAESDDDLLPLRDRSARLDAELATVVDGIAQAAEPVYKYFMGFPDLREALFAGDAAADLPAGQRKP